MAAEIDDLVWSVNSPPLFAGGEGGSVPGVGAVDLPAARSRKVGYYFESLVQFWLERIRGCEMVAHREQVIEHGVTRGELDFVFRDEQGRLNHWETAVKFYLCDPDHPVDGSCFIGPNTSDTLERKHRRLIERQLPLSERVYPDVAIRRAFVKGRIYRHPLLGEGPSPRMLNPHHLRGRWLRCGQLEWLDELERDGCCEYRILEKPFWLCSAPFASFAVNNLRARLQEHFERAKKSVHVGISRDGVEIERLFVVADDWPRR